MDDVISRLSKVYIFLLLDECGYALDKASTHTMCRLALVVNSRVMQPKEEEHDFSMVSQPPQFSTSKRP
jgi:hypothetical protein